MYFHPTSDRIPFYFCTLVTALILFSSASVIRATNLDLAFGSNGRSTTTMCGGGVFGSDVYIQPGGRVVYAGSLLCPGTLLSNPSTGIFATTSSGQLDPSFANAGKFLIFGNFRSASYLGSAMQPDGKLLVYYSTTCPDCGVANYVLFRLTATGATDPTFNAVLPSVLYGGQTNIGVALA